MIWQLLTFGGNATDDALSDGDLRKLQAEGRLRLTLVDHNAMTPRQQKLKLPEAVVRRPFPRQHINSNPLNP